MEEITSPARATPRRREDDSVRLPPSIGNLTSGGGFFIPAFLIYFSKNALGIASTYPYAKGSMSSDSHYGISRKGGSGSKSLFEPDVTSPIKNRTIQDHHLYAGVLDTVISDVAEYLRASQNKKVPTEVKTRYRKTRQWVEDNSDSPMTFLWMINVVCVDLDSNQQSKLVSAFRKIVRLELLPACVDPNTFRRLD